MILRIGRPRMTAIDYVVMAINPVLIMLLLGSLCYFLIEVFFHGAAANNVRWVMFWFVMAVVLVTRLAIEDTEGKAMVYGFLLAVVTWAYIASFYPAFILGAFLLAAIWWCANRLTRDCTLLDETADASGNGLLQSFDLTKKFLSRKQPPAKVKKIKGKQPKPPAHPHGLSVVYFSVAAIPIFGFGQVLLPAHDPAARRAALYYLFLYVAAGLGLLLTTSFLGLRRYLRQRQLQMSDSMAFGWLRFGFGVMAFVLAGALLIPRPDVHETWHSLRYQVDHRVQQASDYALKFNPSGKGKGRAGNESDAKAKDGSADGNPQPNGPGQTSPSQNSQSQTSDKNASAPSSQPSGSSLNWLKILFWVIVISLVAWWIYRKWSLIQEMVRAFIDAIRKFWQMLFGGFSWKLNRTTALSPTQETRNPFSAYRNPFLTGNEARWSFQELVLYTFEAVQAWSLQAGIPPRPEQTAREFCAELSSQFPEITTETQSLSYLYYYAAYNDTPPNNYDLKPIKKLWGYLYGK